MPWKKVSIMDQWREFVRLAMQEGANRREFYRRFGIHPSTAYKWQALKDGVSVDSGSA